jgi:hypothetical protein
MKPPMILPWLAQRAGVSTSRAEVLWRTALGNAESKTGERDTSRYWGAALQILLDLLRQERWQESPLVARPWLLIAGSVGQWSRLLRLWLTPLPLRRPYRLASATRQQ